MSLQPKWSISFGMNGSPFWKRQRCLAALARMACLMVFTGLADHPGLAEEKIYRNEVVPLIVIDEVPLSDAIRNLARQMEMNHILHPAVPGSGFMPGKRMQEPLVSRRWVDVTAAQALRDVLNQHRLLLLTNSGTTVAQVAPNRPGVKPLQDRLAVPGSTHVVPLLKLDDLTLAAGIEHVGRLAGVRVWFDSEVPSSLLEETLRVRWTNLTARQALAALVDNYGLAVEENPVTKGARVRLKD